MQDSNKELEEISARFCKQKERIPKDIRWKLQYMLDFIHHKPNPLQQLSQEHKNQIKDLEDLTPRAITLVFISIVSSILSPNMYCSFEKNCKIKFEGPINRWIKVYVTFAQNQICFNTRKRIIKLAIQGLQCHSISETELQLKYKGIRKLKIKFQHEDAARNMNAKLTEIINEYKTNKQKQSGEDLILNDRMFQQSLKQDYKVTYKYKQNLFMVHKTQPKIHITLFLQGHFWNISDLAEFVSSQKFWNSKVKQQKFIQSDNNNVLIERRFKSSSLLSLERRTFTKLSFKKMSETCYLLQQQNQPGVPTSKSIIISEIYIKAVFEMLSQKIIKFTMDCCFNAKGYCSKANSKSMLVDLFSDIVFIQDRYEKIKTKGLYQRALSLDEKLTQTNRLEKIKFLVIDNVQQKNKEIKGCEKSVNIEKQKQEEGFYSIVINKNYFDEEEPSKSKSKQQKDEFFDIEDCFDTEMEQFNSSNLQQNFKNAQTIMQCSQNKKMLCKKQQSKYINQQSLQKQFEVLKPDNYDKKISIEYVKLIKELVHEKIYLKKHFQQENLKSYNSDTPWYDPSVIIPSGKEYKVSEKKELIFINYDLIKGQKDSLIFVIKQVGANLISGKSVLNVSLPVDIFESRSLLERSAASFGYAPKYLKPAATLNIFQQMKSVIGFMLSVAPLELIMLKPFNPILGETFQAYLGGIPLSYEQISHHPPISSYYMACHQFTLYGNLQAVANVSLNSGSGGNAGKMHIIFQNGSHFEVSFFPGEISGLIYGKRKYSICQKAFVFERTHNLVTEISIGKQSKGLYEWKQINKIPTAGDLIGAIFKVKQKFLKENPVSKSMMHHSGLKKGDIQEKVQVISGLWFSDIYIGKNLINQNMTAYPVQYCQARLPSDANYRMDILMHRLGDLARSQSQKQILEHAQRNDRKLRQKFANEKKKS